jgi:hypothetical protein
MKLTLQTLPKLTSSPTYRIDICLRYFVRTIDDYKKEGLDIDPDFQRGHVWNDVQRTRWVEYLLKGGKVHHALMANQPDWMGTFQGEFVLVDGKQRLTATYDFLTNKFPVFCGLYGNPKGYFAEDIDPACLNNAHVPFAVNTLQTRKEVLAWYLELNEGAVAHTPEELARVKKLLENS